MSELPADNTENSKKFKKNSIKKHVVFFLISFLFVWLPMGLVFWLSIYAFSLGHGTGENLVQVYIPPRSNLIQISRALSAAGAVKDDFRFALLARISNKAHRLKAGEYLFQAGKTPLDILQDLAQGKMYHRSLTLTEGSNIFQAAELLEEKGWGTKNDFLNLVQDEHFIKGLSLKVANLEGYLFPDTYFFQKDSSQEEIVQTMIGRFQQVLAEECKSQNDYVEVDCSLAHGLQEKVEIGEKIKLNVHQLLTMASIVEKETGLDAERPLVAKVFLNRLQKGMRLQADPTVIYGLQKFGKVLSKKDLQTPTAYNTYTIPGLPKGPICNPGRASIAAVLRPSKENYLYFVSENDGSHYFSKTLREHNKAVARFRSRSQERKR